MRRVAHQQITCTELLRCRQSDQWPLTPLADVGNAAQAPPKGRLKGINEFGIVEVRKP